MLLHSLSCCVSVVLADPHKKAIYDTTGIKGLETDGWEVLISNAAFSCLLKAFFSIVCLWC